MVSRRIMVLLVLSALMGTLTFNLGQWQTRRAEEKTRLEAQREAAIAQAELTPTEAVLPDPDTFRFRRARLTGEFIEGAWVALDNRQIGGRPAVSIVQAFRVSPGGFVVMVDRGLLLRDPASPRTIPEFPHDSQTVTIEGFFLERFARTAELWGLRVADASEIHRNGREWSNFSVSEFEREFAGPLGSARLGNYVIAQFPGPKDGFVRNEPRWSSDVAKHRGYAFQWYSLTVLLAVMVAVLLWRGRRDSVNVER